MSIEAMKRWREALWQASITINSVSVQNSALASLRELDQAIEQAEQADKEGSPCPEFWDWLPKAYNFEGDGNFTKYNMEVAFLAGKQAQQAQPVACIACDQAHAVLDADESKIIRDAKDGYPEGRKPRVLTLAERVSALCTYAADWKRWCLEKEAAPPPLQPLDGAAKTFQAMIDALQAGDSYESVLRQFGYVEAEQAQPVAWMWRCKPHCGWPEWSVSLKRPADSGRDGHKRTEGYEDVPLYLSPQPRQPEHGDSARLDWLTNNPLEALDIFGHVKGADAVRWIRQDIDNRIKESA